MPTRKLLMASFIESIETSQLALIRNKLNIDSRIFNIRLFRLGGVFLEVDMRHSFIIRSDASL